MKQLALLGAGGHGRVVADTALAVGWERVVFFDDAWPEFQSNIHWDVTGNIDVLLLNLAQFDGIIVSTGNCSIRCQKQGILKAAGANLVNIVHPKAYVSPNAKLGVGIVVMACAVVNTDASIGDASIVNTGATVDHDCVLEEGVHISPGAHLSGNVSIGRRSWIGVGSSVRQGIRIGKDVVVGAGAVVVKDIDDGITVAGNPANRLIDSL